MSRSSPPPRPRETRGRDATDIGQGLIGIALVIALALGAAGIGWLLSLLISWVY